MNRVSLKIYERCAPIFFRCYFFALFFCLFTSVVKAQHRNNLQSSPIKIDFSYAGYKGGSALPPNVPAMLLVHPSGSDDTSLLQAAIDSLSKLSLKNGFRGAIKLAEGRYKVSGQLFIEKSGIVIKGESKSKTIIVASGINRRTLITIGDKNDSSLIFNEAVPIADSVIYAGSRVLTLTDMTGINVGDQVSITRPSTANWIAEVGMNKSGGVFANRRGLNWPPASRNLVWDREIAAIDRADKQVTLDAPLTTALEQRYGGGTFQKLISGSLPHNIGLEGFTIESEYDRANKHDEEHSWIGIAINYATDVWVRDITARHFVSSAIRVGHHARRVTIEGCISEEPISEIGGYRRYTFLIDGQQVLVKNCFSDSGINDFAIGFCAAGPNVFLNDKATNALGASGSFESWASGVLYENVTIEGAGLNLTYDFDRAQAGGWTAVNSVIWNSNAKVIEALGPIEYPNKVINESSSLYNDQLAHRLDKDVDTARSVSDFYGKESSAIPVFTLSDISKRSSIKPLRHPFHIINGHFVVDDTVIWSGGAGDQYWKGQPFPAGDLNSGVSITRYVPGKVGHGLTEDLPALAQRMVTDGDYFYNSVTGLWYDRRRDDHFTKKRKDGNVWAPFYEMPWARTGKGTAWDGLSLYDLNKYNPWYFKRLKDFAKLCDENGLVFYYNLYNTHNLLEYEVHWVDYPWRPANNINKTGLPEPPPVEPWARLHMGNQFYNPDNARLRKLHHDYIFHVLDELGFSQNVVFSLGIQFAGPLKFQQFFLRTLSEWEKANNRRVHVVLKTTKDITDSILNDSALQKLVDVIDTRYWQYRPAGSFSNSDSLWAPPGGNNRSFREMVGEAFLQESGVLPLPTTQELMYKQVREYTDRFPRKAVVSVYNTSPIPSLMAGGAQVLMGTRSKEEKGHITFHSFIQKHIANKLMNMNPNDDLLTNNNKNWCLADDKKSFLLIYSRSGSTIKLAKNISDFSYKGIWFDPLSERTLPFAKGRKLQDGAIIEKPTKNNWVLFLTTGQQKSI